MSQYHIPKEALNLVRQKRKEWWNNMPDILKDRMVEGYKKRKIKQQYLRSGVAWPYYKPRMVSWSYFMPIPGRKTDRKPRIKAERIAEAMAAMPDLIAEHRENLRQISIKEREEKQLEMQREELFEAASKRLTDMRQLVDEFDELDDTWFDGDDNYYTLVTEEAIAAAQQSDRLPIDGSTGDTVEEMLEIVESQTLASSLKPESDPSIDPSLSQSSEDHDDSSVQKSGKKGKSSKKATKDESLPDIADMKTRQMKHRKKLRRVLLDKKLLDPTLDKTEETLDYKLRKEKLDPTDGDWDDGRIWDKERSMNEMAYLQELANERPTEWPETHKKKD